MTTTSMFQVDTGPRHILVCCALGIGHYTPAANVCTLLLAKSPTILITYFAPVRTWEDKGCRPPPPSDRLHFVKHLLAGEDVHPVTMNAMLTRQNELLEHLTSVLAETRRKGWPEITAIVRDPFALYATTLANTCYKYAASLWALAPSHTLTFALMGNNEMCKSVLALERYKEMRCAKGANESRTGIYLDNVGGQYQGTDSKTESYKLNLSLLWHMAKQMYPEPVFLAPEFSTMMVCEGILTSNIGHIGLPDGMASAPVQGGPSLDVGPLCLWDENVKDAQRNGGDTLTWLNARDQESVLMIAFGTLYPVPSAVMRVLAETIASMKIPCLWVYSDKKAETQPIPTAELQKLAGDTCLVAGWVNQREILAHRALRAFATHGGWNSLVESMTLGGLPLLMMPLGSEQHVNAILCCDVWKIGILGMLENEKFDKLTISEARQAFLDRFDIMNCDFKEVAGTVLSLMPEEMPYKYPDTVSEMRSILYCLLEERYAELKANAMKIQVQSLKNVIPHGSVDSNTAEFFSRLHIT